MKFIHTADLHLASKMKTKLSTDLADKLNGKLFSSLEKLCLYARSEKASAVVIAGDLFDSDTVALVALERFKNIVHRYADLEFVFVYGNHDFSPINDIFADFSKNFTVLGKGQSKTINGVVFYGELPDKPLAKESYNVVIAHGQTSSSTAEDYIPLSRLQDKNIDYLALGHIHEYKIEDLDYRGKWAYSGCLMGRGFDECGDKGFIIVDTDLDTAKFVKLNSTFYDIPFDMNDVSDVFDFENRLDKILTMSNESAVRVTLIGKIAQDKVFDYKYVYGALSERFFYFEFKDKTNLSFDENDHTKSMKTEFIKVVKSKNSIYENEIIQQGLRYLNENK